MMWAKLLEEDREEDPGEWNVKMDFRWPGG
jgi:hypothetical protein